MEAGKSTNVKNGIPLKYRQVCLGYNISLDMFFLYLYISDYSTLCNYGWFFAFLSFCGLVITPFPVNENTNRDLDSYNLCPVAMKAFIVLLFACDVLASYDMSRYRQSQESKCEWISNMFNVTTECNNISHSCVFYLQNAAYSLRNQTFECPL